MENREDLIKARAYELWQKAGMPHGQDRIHWEEAERLVEAELSAPARNGAAPKKRTPRKNGDAAHAEVTPVKKVRARAKPKA